MAEPLLKIQALSKCFGGVSALNDVSFFVKRGIIKAIIGPNGAGKTTLFNVIAGNLQPTTGAIYFEGNDVTRLSDYHMAGLGVARTFQTTRVFHGMTVLENVMIGRHTHSCAGFFGTALRLPAMRREEQDIEAAARKSLEFVGMGAKANAMAETLPFREQRLLEFARALATQPRLLLADEPAAGLNTRETKEIAALIAKIHKQGITILLVEHDMSLVMNISDEILVLDFGSKIAEGTAQEVRRNEKVVSVYLGRRDNSA
ncbi:MAG TPA: ABC transporter ATP-binding protein [Candidatus Sumerlaeota bacterium]|nr:ABC transporter ATP-binding protein [Candidatus Sumerlaeota bacterium]HON50267.1 ABC transporter ATP-binding protein [Candidatus Sumerlaeota bacterium]HOR63484.1 ABC transporter ATP-binding protein [Candidatus Sumerlaeota bacterium]HPL73449.1 ABC transporter ATP-binding protein [Candidatus Sumerlaeota bacterium]HRU54177.1 ABC transporter ATP-binding protein [Candidatus Sumerlaeia bacterium]